MLGELLNKRDYIEWAFLLESAYLLLCMPQHKTLKKKRVVKWIECLTEVIFMKESLGLGSHSKTAKSVTSNKTEKN